MDPSGAPLPKSGPAPPAGPVLPAWLDRLATAQRRASGVFLLAALVLVAASLWLASGLRIRPGFDALLPESRPSVIELDRVKKLTTGVSTVFVVLEGDDTPKLRRAAVAIASEARKLGKPWVGSAEAGVQDAMAFMRPRLGLFSSLQDLTELKSDIDERYRYEVGREAGLLLDDDDDDDDDGDDPSDVPPKLDAETIKKRFGLNDNRVNRYPDGYYQSEDGRAVVITIRSGVMGSDFEEGSEALRRIKAAVSKANPSSIAPGVSVGYAGDLVTGIAEYQSINDDLTEVGLWGMAFIIGIVLLYYLRFRTLITMVATIAIGVSVSFGLTRILVGHLNMATGFLFTIIAGNGINTGIIYMARYLEARRNGTTAPTAVSLAHADTWLPTLTASCAASAAYGSLVITEFRGFRDFGIIGGVGMVSCWLCTVLFLPPILLMTERLSPMEASSTGLFGLLPKTTAGGTRFGAPFARLVAAFPRVVAVVGILLGVVAIGLTASWVINDPMEYDLRNLRGDMSHRREQVRLSDLAQVVTGFVGQDGMAIVVDDPKQVAPLKAKLEGLNEAADHGQKPFGALFSLHDFVPTDQAKKIPLILGIKKKLLKARKRGVISDKDFAELSPYLPPESLAPFGIDELPIGIARPFTENDGTRGRIVYISPTDAALVDDAKYLFRWADTYRKTTLPDGSVVKGSGRAVIYADMWQAIVADIPRAVTLSLFLTLFVVAAAFRAGRATLLVFGALILGVAWMTGLLALLGVRLNFLNFIALPITFGIGVDYAVNVMQRYRREGSGGVLTAVRETGGAVVLCSLTTTLGYLALIRSINHGVRSLGVAAVLGEAACLVAAILVLPALLFLRDARAKRLKTSADDERAPT